MRSGSLSPPSVPSSTRSLEGRIERPNSHHISITLLGTSLHPRTPERLRPCAGGRSRKANENNHGTNKERREQKHGPAYPVLPGSHVRYSRWLPGWRARPGHPAAGPCTPAGRPCSRSEAGTGGVVAGHARHSQPPTCRSNRRPPKPHGLPTAVRFPRPGCTACPTAAGWRRCGRGPRRPGGFST